MSKKNRYIASLDGSREIPIFLLKNENSSINYNELKDGLKIVGDFLDKTILKPNNISYPITRSEFLNLIKWI